MTLIAGAIAIITLYLLLQMFRSANPAVLARAIRFGGGVVSYIGRLGLSFFSWMRRISRSSSGANIDAGPQS